MATLEFFPASAGTPFVATYLCHEYSAVTWMRGLYLLMSAICVQFEQWIEYLQDFYDAYNS
jgi:hypothetical protein